MSQKFIIDGGKPLIGEVRVRGAKNAATKMMIASLLTDEPCELANFPHLGDTAITRELIQAVGGVVEEENGAVRLHTPEITNPRVKELSRKNRIPILALGPLLNRCGVAEVPVLGGDKIGPRPVNFHIEALTQMGAKIENSETLYRATTTGLHGAEIDLPYPSVGATENIILSAVLAKGKTTIKNAATEPEIIDLITMLHGMGAIVEIGANRAIAIEGVRHLRGTRHTILPDRNEVVSFASLAIATHGKIHVRGARHEHLTAFLNACSRLGAKFRTSEDGIEFWCSNEGLSAVEIETDTHPGFMTDWQQPFAVILTGARGRSIIHETVYEERLGYTADLIRMGADIKLTTECLGSLPCRFRRKSYNHSYIICGPTPLRGAELTIPDIRAGIAQIIAALSARGTSEVWGVEHIDRGYENIDERLRALGAEIKRVEV